MADENEFALALKKEKESKIDSHIKRLRDIERSSQISQQLSFSRGLKRILGAQQSQTTQNPINVGR